MAIILKLNNFINTGSGFSEGKKFMDSSTRNLLKRNGFRHSYLRRFNNTQYEEAPYPYKPFESVKHEVAKDNPKELHNINEKFVKLIGEDAFIAYSKRAGLLKD